MSSSSSSSLSPSLELGWLLDAADAVREGGRPNNVLMTSWLRTWAWGGEVVKVDVDVEGVGENIFRGTPCCC